MGEIGREGAIKTASGDTRVGRALGPLVANLVSGDLTIGESRDALTTATVSGDQEIEIGGGGKVKLQSVSGDVRVGVPPGLRLCETAKTCQDVTSSRP